MKKMRANNKILITGLPGVGKTTLLIHLFEKLRSLKPIGFYTSEIRKNNIRQGFELVDLGGKRSVLSHVKISSPFRVGKYGVDVPAFEMFLDSIDFLNPESDLILIDEIGKMECFSNKFKKLVEVLLDSEKPLIASIALRGEGFIARIKKHPDTKLFELTKGNRNILQDEISGLFGY